MAAKAVIDIWHVQHPAWYVPPNVTRYRGWITKHGATLLEYGVPCQRRSGEFFTSEEAAVERATDIAKHVLESLERRVKIIATTLTDGCRVGVVSHEPRQPVGEIIL